MISVSVRLGRCRPVRAMAENEWWTGRKVFAEGLPASVTLRRAAFCGAARL